MPKLEVKRAYPGKSSEDCYQAALRLVEKAGYRIFKKREIASLVMCEGLVGGQPTSLSVMSPFGFPTSIVLALSSEAASEAALRSEADRLFALLEHEL